MDIDAVRKMRSLPLQGYYCCREANYLVKDCLHYLDIQRLIAEQREELIEDLMALKDVVEKKEVCLAWPAKSVPQLLLVNRFTVLDIEEVNTDICEPIDAPFLSSSAPDRITQPQKPK